MSAIQIWEYSSTPEKYKKLFEPNDIDYIAFIPKKLWNESYGYIWFLEGYHWRDNEDVFLTNGVVRVCRHS